MESQLQQSSNDEIIAKINQEVCKNEWVLDDDYSRSQQLKWQHVDTIIWVDYGFWRTLYQVFIRVTKREWYRDEL